MKNIGLSVTLLLFTVSLYSQNVGITDLAGGITPYSILHLHLNSASGNLLQLTNATTGNGSNIVGFKLNYNGNDISFINNQAGYMSFHTSNTERMRILSGGNVGIGTTAPAAQLHTTGTVRLANYPAGVNGAILKTNASGDLSITNFSGSASDVLLGNGTFTGIPAGSGNYIQNQYAGAQVANYWISGESRTGSWFRNSAVNTGLYNETTGAGIYSPGAGLMSTYNSSSFQIEGASNGAGNLRFTAANPYIVSSSYFVCPGGAYFNSGTVYTEAAIQVRGGINNDSGNFGGDVQVNENLRFLGALMPNGNAGTPGSFLRSSGPGTPPTWTSGGVAVASVNTVESTADLCINNATFTTYPGCSAVLNLVPGQKVAAWAEAGLMADDNCDGLSDISRVIVDARIAVNGADFAEGAWLRTSLDNSVGYVMFNSVTLIGSYTCTVAGAYTFAFQARRAGGGAGDNAISGGNNTSSLQATMVLIVYTP